MIRFVYITGRKRNGIHSILSDDGLYIIVCVALYRLHQTSRNYRPKKDGIINKSVTPITPLPIIETNDVPPPPLYNEYEVTFTTPTLGVTMSPTGNDGLGCMVRTCLTAFAAHSIQIGSIVCAVNGHSVLGFSYQKIRDIIRQNAEIPPIRLSLRAEINQSGMGVMSESDRVGSLQIEIVSGLRLKHTAKYVYKSEMRKRVPNI